ncbi:hypothetical protein D3C76_1543490 [compost metagenome]
MTTAVSLIVGWLDRHAVQRFQNNFWRHERPLLLCWQQNRGNVVATCGPCVYVDCAPVQAFSVNAITRDEGAVALVLEAFNPGHITAVLRQMLNVQADVLHNEQRRHLHRHTVRQNPYIM